MSNKNILELPDKKLKELFQEVHPGSKYPLIDTEDLDLALEYYKDKFIIPYQSLSITPSKDYKYLQANAVDIVKDAIGESFRGYPEYRAKISDTYQETNNWDKVITTAVYRDVDISQEAFIEEVEEVYNTKVKDAKHLQKLTGISEDKGETLEGLEETLNTARYSKYFRALSIILKNGGTYSDLLQVEPKDYDLPETWEGTLGKDKLTTIYWAVGFHYNLTEPAFSLVLLPNIRYYAEDLKAPFSFIMDVYTHIHRISKEDAIKEIKSLSNDLGGSTYEKVISLVKASISEQRKTEIDALTEEEKIFERYLPYQPEIPKTKKGVEQAIDSFISDFEPERDRGAEILDYLGILYDSWGWDAKSKEVADQLRAEVNYTDIEGELTILDSADEVRAKVKKILQAQPVEVLNSLYVFGVVTTEEQAKQNIETQLNDLPETITNLLINAIPLKGLRMEQGKYFHDIRSSYPKQYKALKYYYKFYSVLKGDAILDKVKEILK